MGHPRLDPFNLIARRIRESNLGDESDRKAAIAFAYDVRDSTSLSLADAAMVCRGIYAMLQCLHIEAQILAAETGSGIHKNLVWVHNKHIEEMAKCFVPIKKGVPHRVGRKVEAAQTGRAAMWHPTRTGHTAASQDPESA